MEPFIICQDCNFKVNLTKEELFYNKYILCICGNLIINPNFDEVKLKRYLEVKNGIR